ncbi:hypothetical protein JXB02_03880 [Candidatus Woesearchaeota archaeon]|nr:hypothetical protein [Candidatus Woesearchaeota archaeon]
MNKQGVLQNQLVTMIAVLIVAVIIFNFSTLFAGIANRSSDITVCKMSIKLSTEIEDATVGIIDSGFSCPALQYEIPKAGPWGMAGHIDNANLYACWDMTLGALSPLGLDKKYFLTQDWAKADNRRNQCFVCSRFRLLGDLETRYAIANLKNPIPNKGDLTFEEALDTSWSDPHNKVYFLDLDRQGETRVVRPLERFEAWSKDQPRDAQRTYLTLFVRYKDDPGAEGNPYHYRFEIEDVRFQAIANERAENNIEGYKHVLIIPEEDLIHLYCEDTYYDTSQRIKDAWIEPK